MDKPKTHGGTRANAGRKSEVVGSVMTAKTFTIDNMTLRKLKVVGGDNLSKGVRIAAGVAFQMYQDGRLDPPDGQRK